MTDAGFSKFADDIQLDTGSNKPLKNIVSVKINKETNDLFIPADIKKAFKSKPIVWINFNKLAESYKSNYIKWINSAKRDETRKKRIDEAIGLIEKNEKLGLK